MTAALFEGVPANPRRRAPMLLLSTIVHVMVALASIATSILRAPEAPPTAVRAIRVHLDAPPPPPPPPLPRGAGFVDRLPERRRPSPSPRDLMPSAPVTIPEEVRPGSSRPSDDPAGSETGSDLGVPEGMEDGRPGGVIGGVPGGIPGGVIGGTGSGPIPTIVDDYDKPPRLVRQVKPAYPQEAFSARIEGIVLVEFVIDATGAVVEAHIAKSVPGLDAAALQAVRQWLFTPAQQHGRPVASRALAPIEFRIY